ncbi:uncharacterized protein [Diadema antillarum]|uniref:uncharacterized protein n=1 Tax=Diadema antillarum TaxID=105358 RepID=UPI003A8C267A
MASARSVSCLCFVIRIIGILAEPPFITVLSIRYSSIETTSNDILPEYQCYRSEGDDDVDLDFGRLVPTTSSSPPDPPEEVPHSADENVLRIFFPHSPSSWQSDWTAKFAPREGAFTRTVNVGDTGVIISMDVLHGPSAVGGVINWRKNGGQPIAIQNGLTDFTLMGPIRQSDQGVFEVYYENERDTGRGGLFRLIVRECPAGKWDPPDCLGVCDKCYNGGICDDKTGYCICPNNFMGPNCLEICRPRGGNRFGVSCEFRCTHQLSDDPQACSSYMFCLPDPYGCTCDVGVKGLACDTACDSGEFGPGCSQTCHCQDPSSCSRFTGECSDSSSPDSNLCESGWSGQNCQIPDVCDTGYYGMQCIDKCHCENDVSCDKITGECPQRRCAAGYRVESGQIHCSSECQHGFYGEDCAKACHCQDEACDTVTGSCTGQCLLNWLEPDCQTGVDVISRHVQVNPISQALLFCRARGNPLPSDTDVGLYSLSQTTAELEWLPWTPGVDTGDPPLVAYAIFIRRTSQEWSEVSRVSSSSTSVTISDLDADTDYEFSVAPVREGTGGTGTRSAPVFSATLCPKPSGFPLEVNVSSNETLPQQLIVTWKPPDNTESNCRSGFTHYIIYYAIDHSHDVIARRLDDISVTRHTLTCLGTGLKYRIYVTAWNKDSESRESNVVVTRTPGSVQCDGMKPRLLET